MKEKHNSRSVLIFQYLYELLPHHEKKDGNSRHFKGLEITGAADNGLYLSGNHNTIEMCIFHHNRDNGLQLGRYSEEQTAITDWL